jgi:hypothetical protein
MRSVPPIPVWLSVLLFGVAWTAQAAAEGGALGQRGPHWVDLTHAVVDLGPTPGPVERKAAQMLSEEAAKRSGVTLQVVTSPPASETPVIRLALADRAARSGPEWPAHSHIPNMLASGPLPSLSTLPSSLFPLPSFRGSLQGPTTRDGRLAPEGFVLNVAQNGAVPAVTAQGNDPRGCMFAAGYLLRKMRFTPGKIEAPEMRVVSAPARPVRGHQLGWRAQSNTYDRWGVREYEQYIRDLIVWGVNAIELIPYFPDTDPAASEELTVQLADVIHSYGLDVWLWFPFNDRTPAGVTGDGLTPGVTACPSRKDGRRFLRERRTRLFRRMKYLDAVFIPGGDPGGCECELCRPWEHTFLPLSGETAQILQETHPGAQLWLSNQMFSSEENRHFHDFLEKEHPAWLAGLVYSPWAGETCRSARDYLPGRYALRMYPDITHALRCQFTIPDWDQAFASTLDREPPLYRPTQTAHLAKAYQSLTCGAITYSDGVNDDLHKALWSAYLWNPKADLHSLLTDYGRYYFGGEIGDRVAEGILAIERNAHGPLKSNPNVERTYALWSSLDREAPPALRQNWRFQMALLRACFDLYVQRKLRADLKTEEAVYAALRPRSRESLSAALEVLTAADARTVEPELRAKLLSLGQALFDSIGMQLSVPRWGASGEERGAILDHLDVPLANQAWLKAELTKLTGATDAGAIRAGIDRIVNWENPGPGGFYDDLGDPLRQPHLVRTRSWAEDPDSMASPRCDFHGAFPNGRQTWNHYAETLYDTPLNLHYEGLDPKAQYSVRVTYSGRFNPVMTLTANDRYSVHGPVPTSNPPIQQEWPVPREATGSGTLTLTWRRVSGRGCQVAEVWLIRKP